MDHDFGNVDDQPTISALRGLVGCRISQVEYCLNHGTKIADALDPRFDRQLEGLRIQCGGDAVAHFFWYLRPPDEHLHVRVDGDFGDSGYPGDWPFYDATTEPKWAKVIGVRIEVVGASVGPVGSYGLGAEAVVGTSGIWSARLGFEDGTSLVIALGEDEYPDRHMLRVSADGLVVIADDALARSFRAAPDHEPAWGHDLDCGV